MTVTDLTRHQVDPADEQRHGPGPELLWNESYYLDFVAGEGAIAGYVRIGLYPNLGVTWWTTMIVGADRPVVASVAYDLPVIAGDGLALSSGGVDVSLGVEGALRGMAIRATAPATLHDTAGAIYRGEPGRPVTVGLDLTWATDGTPYHYDLTTRYEVPCLVSGEVTVGDEHIAVDGHGQRDHSWGVRDWWAFGWCWTAARLDDGTRVHAADIRIPGQPVAFGYVQVPGRSVDPVSELQITEVGGEEGMPVTARALIEPGSLDLHIQPLAYGPLLLVGPDGRVSRFPRAAARFVAADGLKGTGWIEWNQPEPPGTGQ
ncbi:MAG: DUF7065 domain-containing protein [Acidimicrobiales bacterium]